MGPVERRGDRGLVVHIDPERLRAGFAGPEKRRHPLRVPRPGPHLQPMIEQMPDDPAAEEAGAAEDGDDARLEPALPLPDLQTRRSPEPSSRLSDEPHA